MSKCYIHLFVPWIIFKEDKDLVNWIGILLSTTSNDKILFFFGLHLKKIYITCVTVSHHSWVIYY